jgi:hypothetical protein
MTTSTKIWTAVPRANFVFLHAARVQAHYAVQWLARAARAYIAPQPHDRHTSLGWDDAFGGLVTQALPDGSRLGLRIHDLTLAFLDVHPHHLALDGRSETEVRTWLGGHIAACNLVVGKLDDPSPYAMPDHVLAIGARYSLEELGDAFKVLATWFANSHAVLSGVQKHLAAKKLKAPAVRCWPHHFDLDSLVYFSTGKDAHSMGLGFSPGDHYYDEPYFYISLYPAPSSAFPPLPAIAHWHTHHFTAAVAPAGRILAAIDPLGAVRSYVAAATDFAISELGQSGQAVTSGTAG